MIQLPKEVSPGRHESVIVPEAQLSQTAWKDGTAKIELAVYEEREQNDF